ncbi:hypothetical protein J5Y05_15015 [Streptomyces sp. RG38]|uniref:Lipoprotein n=1 Tax=Streptomyces tagetis TaxID=2820809 RepID=A0A940XI35_9ACTN|nr:hypothetical protein [Streptomyces sp. RG38]
MSSRRAPRRYAFLGAVLGAVALSCATACSGTGGDLTDDAPPAVRTLAPHTGVTVSGASSPAGEPDEGDRSPLPPDDGGRSPLPPGAATAMRCGPGLNAPGGLEARTCVLTQGAETWARTSYRNATGRPLESVLRLTGPGGQAVRARCPVGAGDAPDVCETSRQPLRGGAAGYEAVAEFTERDGGGTLLRSGSNFTTATGG